MHAYYYSFTPTGVEEIDRILSAVACAGKAFHHTDHWTDDVYDLDESGKKVPAPYESFLRGMTPVEWIQHAAEDAAQALVADAREGASHEFQCGWPMLVTRGKDNDTLTLPLPSPKDGLRDATGGAA